MRDIDFVDKNLMNILTFQEEGKWRRSTDVTGQTLKSTLLEELPVVVKAPSLLSQFLLATTKHTISLVNKETGKEFVLVQQRSTCEHDCLEDLFITYKTCKQGT